MIFQSFSRFKTNRSLGALFIWVSDIAVRPSTFLEFLYAIPHKNLNTGGSETRRFRWRGTSGGAPTCRHAHAGRLSSVRGGLWWHGHCSKRRRRQRLRRPAALVVSCLAEMRRSERWKRRGRWCTRWDVRELGERGTCSARASARERPREWSGEWRARAFAFKVAGAWGTW
jgi:hypothetical protein